MPSEKTIKDNQIKGNRAPVVAVMGHIDHGKSTLLDYIRKSNVVAGEAGGITQHISAYEVNHKHEGKTKKITFLDTPGHQAFTSMRQTGSLIADIAILIVSAEEGVKDQTLESLESIKNAGIPFVIAINKIDRPNANVSKIKQNLAENEILVEEFGGKIPSVDISAVTGQGIDNLLDIVLLVTELEELSGNPEVAASGFVLEASHGKQVGTMATLVIKDGSLKTGDYIVIDTDLAKIKKIEDFLGQEIKKASFSSPIRILGLNQTPNAGTPFIVFHNKKEAEKYQKEMSAKQTTAKKPDSPTDDKDQVIIPLIIKSDTAGTLEALQREITKLDQEQIRLKTIQSGIGAINENDARILTGSNNGIILGFNVSVDSTAKDIADRFNIQIETFKIIYKLSEWLELEIAKRRPKVEIEKIIGQAKILKLFSETKNRYVLGGKVTEGKISKNNLLKIWRRESLIGPGKIISLQHNKVEVSEIEAGNEFGVMIEAKFNIAPGDTLQTFSITIE